MDKDKAREAAKTAYVEANQPDDIGITVWDKVSPSVIFDNSFNAGYDARDAKTCVWTFKRFGTESHWLTSCDVPMIAKHTFCGNCGGRITEAK